MAEGETPERGDETPEDAEAPPAGDEPDESDGEAEGASATDDRAPLSSTEVVELEPGSLVAKVEALLFVSPRPVRARALARFLKVEARAVREALADLVARSEGRGVTPAQVSEGWQLRTQPEHGELVRRFLQAKPARLSQAAMETLAIIAYKQPVTRAEVEEIRGVDCGAVIRGLLERRLVRMLGKKDEPGRPIIYGTAPAFLEVFGLRSLRELPTLREFVELSEEHQQILEEQAPPEGEVADGALRAYLDELDEDGAASEWAEDVAQGREEGDEDEGGEQDLETGDDAFDRKEPLTKPEGAGNGLDS